MKKIVFIFIMLFSMITTSTDARTYWYQSTGFAYRQVLYGQWTQWTQWQSSNIQISIDTDNDVIKIYSQMPQVYFVTNYDGTYTDASNGQQIQYSVIDQDRDVGKIRLRIETTGNSQLYVDFANVMWVYNIVRIQ